MNKYVNKNIRKLALGTLIVVFSGSSLPAHGFFGFNPFSAITSIREKYETTKNYAKIITYGTMGFFGYKAIVKPASEMIFGQSAILHKIDRGINFSLLAGCVVGAFYFYDKVVSNGKIRSSIQTARTAIVNNLTDRIRALRDYINTRFNDTNVQLQQIRQDVRTIRTITTENNDILKNGLTKTIEK